MRSFTFCIDDSDVAVVRQHALASDGESDTCAADMAVAGLPPLIESLEYQLAFIIRNTRPFVRDMDAHAGSVLFGAQADRRSRRRELHGIGDEVIEYDFELAAIRLQFQVGHAHVDFQIAALY